MTRILFVTKSNAEPGDGLPMDEVIDIFERESDINVIRQAVENAHDRLVATWASVDIKDKAGEIIPIEDIINQQDILLERNGPITDEHSNKVVGQTVAYKVMEHPETGTMGVLHLNRFYNHHYIDDKVWGEIVNHERTGSSVGGYNTSLSMGWDKVSGESARVLQGFAHLETASVHDPCNPLALNEAFSVVAKSNGVTKTTYDGYDSLNQCVIANKNQDDPLAYCMTKKVLKREVSKGDVQKPMGEYKDFADCVAQNQDKDDPEAYCGYIKAQIEKGCDEENKKDNVINKDSQSNNQISTNKKTEVNKMDKDVEKNSELTQVVQGLSDTVKTLASEVAELKKTQKAEEEKPENKEEMKEDEAVADKKKAEASSDIDGETSAPAPESPDAEDSNESDAFKNMEAIEKRFNSKVDEMSEKLLKAVSKAQTPEPGNATPEVKKKDSFSSVPMDVALGKTKMTMLEATKAFEKHMEGQ